MTQKPENNAYHQALLKQEKEDRYRQYLAHRDAWLALCDSLLISYHPKDATKKYLFKESMSSARELLANTTEYSAAATANVIAALDTVEFYASLVGLPLPAQESS